MPALVEGLRGPALVACLTATLFAQSSPQSPPVGNYTVSGTVINAVTGEPVRRALVNFAGQRSVLTDGDGRFQFDRLPQMTASISVHKPGFFDEQEIAQGLPTESLMA